MIPSLESLARTQVIVNLVQRHKHSRFKKIVLVCSEKEHERDFLRALSRTNSVFIEFKGIFTVLFDDYERQQWLKMANHKRYTHH